MKLRLNTWNTKYSNKLCICQNPISIEHILLECDELRAVYINNNINIDQFNDVTSVLYSALITDIANVLCKSVIGRFL